MTATIDETRLDVVEDEFPEFQEKVAIPCRGLRTDVKCPNEAKFKARIVCCGRVVFFCEDCLLDLKAYLLKNRGSAGKCHVCGVQVTMSPDNVVYLGRIA